MTYLVEIYDRSNWAEVFAAMPLRFQPQLDGRNIKALMRLAEPEKRLWKHMEYVINHWEKIVDSKTHKLYMNFDVESRIKHMNDWPQ